MTQGLHTSPAYEYSLRSLVLFSPKSLVSCMGESAEIRLDGLHENLTLPFCVTWPPPTQPLQSMRAWGRREWKKKELPIILIFPLEQVKLCGGFLSPWLELPVFLELIHVVSQFSCTGRTHWMVIPACTASLIPHSPVCSLWGWTPESRTKQRKE